MLEEYLTNLEKVLEGIPPTHIWNYDETNFRDDPGQRRVLCRKGTKSLEQVCNTTKTAISVMFAGNAAGELLPPYIVYKGEHLWSTWTENGPEKVRYNRTASGWFDAVTFEDWFMQLMLPRLKRLDGPKVLLGDNLASHINENVIAACEQFDVQFVCLPPNSTHLTQPLDVAVFRSVKLAWRNILSDWRGTKNGSRVSGLPKDIFPALLKKLMKKISDSVGPNLSAGFKKCGVYPLEKAVVLQRFKNYEPENVDVSVIGQAFLDHLVETRKDIEGINPGKQRKKKLNVPAGSSITVEQLHIQQVAGDEDLPKKRCGRLKTTHVTDDADSSDSDVEEMELASDEETKSYSEDEKTPNSQDLSVEDKKKLKKDDFVTVIYNQQEFPGIVKELTDKGPIVSCMEKLSKSWRWPQKEDSMQYEWVEVKKKIAPPKLLSKRDYYVVPELDLFVN